MQRRLEMLYRRLLAAYPPDFRDDYGEEMVGLLGEMLRGRAPAEQAVVFARVVGDLARSATRERLSAPRPVALTATADGPTVVADPTPRPPTGPSRRSFLRASMVVAGAGFTASMGGASLAFLWPSLGEGFGSAVDIGSVADVTEGVRASGGTYPVPGARAYVVAYDAGDDPDRAYADIAASGFMALYQRCVHLGCRVPWCSSSTRFECPCHKSRYNRWGEWQDGPAPRGLDRFPVTVVEGRVIVDTRVIVTGPPRMGGVLTEPASGPSCLGV